MNKFDLVYKEIYSQTEELQYTFDNISKSYFGILKDQEVIFTGCGDSYSAALIAEKFSKVKAGDPYELYFEKLETPLVIISVSGRTITNLNLAKKAKKEGIKVIAITGSKENELAKISDLVISTEYKERTVLPGTLSFTKSLIAIFSILGKKVDLNFLKKEWIDKVFEEMSKIKGDSFFIISAPSFFPISIYFKAKLIEFAGRKVIIERCEQFLHMDIFSVKEKDALLIIGEEDKRAKEIYDKLKDKLICCEYLKTSDKSPEDYLRLAIYAQVLGFSLAKRSSLEDFYFTKTKLLKISDELIY